MADIPLSTKLITDVELFKKENIIHKCINPIQSNVLFLYPRKRQKIRGSVTFSEGIEMEHWREMGQI